ncbi:5'-methylthioadenosine/S-adenosylhomocysteine nucleosidase [Salipaludibacillus keqinensis]|jgi:adenosylhomocysteine nucleosidase|uniref:5'-methylthioadenosine/S-adenosylhomocysteine nucleosidase n=1 Tax=Salipaludibacillus keqinensis TaxID=2045207 RepID=A0A323THC9_9BACI|nr:5'-methylthioadenosine/S-adenosylhomocysteine nucleosidase [Salipaludibacillus keqinensis]PYZ94179.1 5'-methylthioadenosine/S-adenosylhomocysteine nucleosidase [Salipaludibacillus keqinensis]
MRIGVIGAMEEEVELLKSEMEVSEEAIIAGCEFFLGRLNGVDVILSKSGIGKVNAAISTTLMNQLYFPDFIINTGSAGGFHHDLAVGDIVISTEVRYNDVDATVFGYEFGQVPRMPAFYSPNSMLISLAEECATEVGVRAVKGLVISGDSFMSDHDRVSDIRRRFNDPSCSEMEAGAIAQVCHQFQTPFVIIRSLSDIAGTDAKISYDQFLETASVHSAKMVMLMLEEIRKQK